MNQFRILVATAAALGAVAVPAAGAASSTAAVRVQTLRFLSVTQHDVLMPAINRESPPQIGGRLVFEDVSYNRAPQFGRPAGARVGRAEGVCTFIRVSKPVTQCVITAHVPNGELVLVGESDLGAKVGHYAITGGVGAYVNARGTVTTTSINQQKTIVVVRLAS